MVGQAVGHPTHHEFRPLDRGLFDQDRLEASGEGGVLLDVLLVFVPGGRGDGSKGAAGKGRFEKVGGIPGALLTTRTQEGVGFVDEEDDRIG